MKSILSIFLVFISFAVNAQNKAMVINRDALQKIENFKKLSKLSPDKFYTGLPEPKLQPAFNKLLNESADDFIFVIHHAPTEKKFQDAIKKGLDRFKPNYLDLDTEDREQICTCYEKLMDAVGLKTSNGILNTWLYGFDPEKK